MSRAQRIGDAGRRASLARCLIALAFVHGCTDAPRARDDRDLRDGPPVAEDVAEDLALLDAAPDSVRDTAVSPVPDTQSGCRASLECNDGNPCTADLCDVTGICYHPAVGGRCDDGDPCTAEDACVEGACVGLAVTCPDEDDDLCTEPVCQPSVGCVVVCRSDAGCAAECGGDAECDDGDPSSIDVCVLRTCSSTCTHYWPPCDDGNPCTADRPDEEGVCRHVPLDGAACDDGSACTSSDRCIGSTCAGLLASCDDGNPCTADRCRVDVGCVVQPLPDGLGCDDGDACTVSDRCQDATCVGRPRECADDGDGCSIEYCDPAEGCLVFCRHSGECAPQCATDMECLDSDPCTLDLCQPTTCSARCEHLPDPCDDGDPCTLDRCQGGSCQHAAWCRQCSTHDDCVDSDPCTVDRCNADLLCDEGVAVLCPDDGDPCTREFCGAGGCVSECVEGCGDPCETGGDCDDGDACTVDACVSTPCGTMCQHRPRACEPPAPCAIAHCVQGECVASIPAVVPTLDGVVGDDWHPRSLAAVEPDESDWPGVELELLRLQVDDNLLYVGVSGHADGPTQAVVGFLDVTDASAGAGVTRLADLHADGGTLDRALAGCAVFDVDGFEVDFAFGTVGMSSAYGAADRAGWRRVTANGGLRWMPEGAVVASAETRSFEAVATLDALFPGGIPAAGAAISLVILASSLDGCACADQSLPDQPEPLTGESPTITIVHRFVVQPALLDCCAAPDDCRDGDPCTYDACDDEGACFHLETECSE